LPLFEKQGGEPAVVEQPAAETPSTGSAKRGHGRRKKPDTLERRDVIHDLNEAEKQALAGGGQLVLIGEEVTEQYEWEPSCLYVLRHVQKKYVCRPALAQNGQVAERQIITAAKPPQPIPGSSAGPGLLAYSKRAPLPVLRRRVSCRGGEDFSNPGRSVGHGSRTGFGKWPRKLDRWQFARRMTSAGRSRTGANLGRWRNE
jgi:hypothetical protein